MVLVNRTGTFPLTLAKFMSTAQTTTVCLESPNLLLHGEHTSALHLLFPVRCGITCSSCFSFGLLWIPKPPCSAISFGVDELLSDGAASSSPPPPPPPPVDEVVLAEQVVGVLRRWMIKWFWNRATLHNFRMMSVILRSESFFLLKICTKVWNLPPSGIIISSLQVLFSPESHVSQSLSSEPVW